MSEVTISIQWILGGAIALFNAVILFLYWDMRGRLTQALGSVSEQDTLYAHNVSEKFKVIHKRLDELKVSTDNEFRMMNKQLNQEIKLSREINSKLSTKFDHLQADITDMKADVAVLKDRSDST